MSENVLKHIAIIMDGNRRWAKRKNKPTSFGHQKGAENVSKIVEAAANSGVSYVTLYAFSTENWQREQSEVNELMALLRKYLKEDIKELMEKDVKVMFVGERDMLDKDITSEMKKIEKKTENNQKITVCIALSYGSRQEILSATKKIAKLVKKSDISVNNIDEKMFSDMLYTKDVPDPDLLIRTSGEKRVSNYLLWQLAYAEMFFTDTLWPDFDKEELLKIIESFNSRERRYGKS